MDLFDEFARFQTTHPVTWRCLDDAPSSPANIAQAQHGRSGAVQQPTSCSAWAGDQATTGDALCEAATGGAVCRSARDTCWSYIACGHGAETVVLLPGALGDAAASFQYITAFEAEYRVLALSYPPLLSQVRALTMGIASLLRAEAVTRMHLVGGSFSGMLAQCFVRDYPERVASLILSHSGVPSPARLRASELYLRAVGRRSLGTLRLFARLANHAAFQAGTPPQRFWRAYFDRAIAALSHEELAARLRLIADFDRSVHFAPADLRGWPGRIMIVDSDGDRYIAPAERLALRTLYPQARVCSLEGVSHSGTLETPQRYIGLYKEFLHG